ncbi:hypothetical protein AGMMS49992_26790 [Clostridia bacterium]|nr:hypothetical protein AGMMS49992_26790 [Clostridia bacterium]
MNNIISFGEFCNAVTSCEDAPDGCMKCHFYDIMNRWYEKLKSKEEANGSIQPSE